jgi:hypothetical protein
VNGHASVLNRLAPERARELAEAGVFGDSAVAALENDTKWRELPRRAGAGGDR